MCKPADVTTAVAEARRHMDERDMTEREQSSYVDALVEHLLESYRTEVRRTFLRAPSRAAHVLLCVRAWVHALRCVRCVARVALRGLRCVRACVRACAVPFPAEVE